MDLNTLCFLSFGVLFTGFLLLEGFDYGVAILLPFIGRSNVERKAIIQTLAPVWDGNEVWLVAAGAFLFAGFPEAYATLFSGMYLALLLILSSLIFRGAALEFRDKVNHATWESFWDWSLFIGGLVPAVLWGVAVSNLVRGLPIDAARQYVGTFGDLLSIYTVSGGLAFAALFLVHGLAFLTLKLESDLQKRLRQVGLKLHKYALGVVVLFGLLTFVYTDLGDNMLASLLLLLSALLLLYAMQKLQNQQYSEYFISSSFSVLTLSSSLFSGLFPRIVISSLDPRWSLTIYNSSANQLTLHIMSTTMLIVLPVLLVLESWKYYVFRQKISTSEIKIAEYTDLLAPMNRKLKRQLRHAYFLADAMASVIGALRNNDSHVINRLCPKHKSYLTKKDEPS